VTSDLNLTYNTTVKMGVGHAQRVPTLAERYADGIFMGIIQSGFSRVIGNPELQKERAWQADLTVVSECDSCRSWVSGFCSWIDNYVTYEANAIADPSGARLLQAINTTYATLAGIEWHGEVDLTMTATGFATIRYLDGRDQGIEQPLAQIAPLESRVGIRLQDPSDERRWGGEFGVRMVDRQHREALFRPVAPAVALIPVEVETPGFTTAYIRGFYNLNDDINLVGGVENLLDRTYVEHLDLRLPDQGAFRNTIAFSPGITPYMGIEWER
jgi:outer membrane receptor for ferrienterochelin and colicin